MGKSARLPHALCGVGFGEPSAGRGSQVSLKRPPNGRSTDIIPLRDSSNVRPKSGRNSSPVADCNRPEKHRVGSASIFNHMSLRASGTAQWPTGRPAPNKSLIYINQFPENRASVSLLLKLPECFLIGLEFTRFCQQHTRA